MVRLLLYYASQKGQPKIIKNYPLPGCLVTSYLKKKTNPKVLTEFYEVIFLLGEGENKGAMHLQGNLTFTHVRHP
jgi:hypothetical protein